MTSMDSPADGTHVDVLVVGAGISGIGAAHQLQQRCPDRSYAILESQSSYGALVCS